MENLITQDLFEAVYNGCNFGKYDANEEKIYYSQPCNIFEGSWVESEIDIHLFAFECKEYALLNGYVIKSYIRSYCRGTAMAEIYNNDWDSEFGEYCIKTFCTNTEVEAIVKAAEWVLTECKI